MINENQVIRDLADIKHEIDIAHTFLNIAMTGKGCVYRGEDKSQTLTKEETIQSAFDSLNSAKAMLDDYLEDMAEDTGGNNG